MKIPKKFKFDENGLSWLDHNIIELCKNTEHNLIPRDKVEHVFCHELSHFLLYNSSFDTDLSDNEAIVDRLALLLHQFLETQEGEL